MATQCALEERISTMGMSGQIQMVEAPDDDPELMVDLGDVADLTLGGPGRGKEDKRYEVG